MPSAAEEVALYLDVPLDVEVELDRRILTVRQILDLDRGSVIRMNRSAGENLDVRIGGALIGFGEIVVNETTTGIRLADFHQNE
jgi:flagellar motor switch protein FliN/FliY